MTDDTKSGEQAEAPIDYQAESGAKDPNLYHEELKEPDEKPEIDDSKTSVAASAKQNIVMMVILAAIIAGVVYFSFFRNSTPKTDHNDIDLSIPSNKPVAASEELTLPSIPDTPPPPPDYNLPQTPKKEAALPLPEAPSVRAPTASMPQQPAAFEPDASAIPTKNSLDNQQRSQAKLKSGIMLSNSGATSDKDKDKEKNKAPLYLESFKPSHTSSAQQKITRVGNMSLLIAQGKIIESVLETPLNTNYPGPIRAVVSADVYSENGNNVLIPRGSRLVGQFTGGYSPGQTRITLTWDRIIMPDGYDIAVNSPAIGQTGTAGVEGIADTQLLPTVTNAVLVSALNIAFTEVASKMTKSQQPTSNTTTTGSAGTTATSTSTPTQQAISQETQNMGNTLKNLAQQNYTTKPFITLDQGTVISVFVNRDILFPKDLANGSKVVG